MLINWLAGSRPGWWKTISSLEEWFIWKLMSAERSANIGVFARPALAGPHIVVCTDWDWHGSIYLFSNHFLLEILSSVRSLTWRPEVSGFWVFELLFIVWEGKLRQCLPYFISLESFTAMRQYHNQSVLPSVFTVLVWCLQFSKLIQPTNTEPANIGCIINEREWERERERERERANVSFLLFVFTWEYEETFRYL